MVKEKRRERKKKGVTYMFVQLLSWSMMVWLILLSVTLAATLRFSMTSLQQKIDSGLASVTSTLAESHMVKEALAAGECSAEMIDYLDDLVEKTEDLDLITIADKNSIRLYHIVHERIGLEFVGGDEGPVLEGKSYIVEGVGTLGPQRRSFSPVLGEDGSVVGFVVASSTTDRIQALRDDITSAYAKITIILVLVTLVLTAFLTLIVRHMLHGYSPEELVNTYLTQNEMLDGLEEGIVSVDAAGEIKLVNRAAEKMLDQKAELLEGAALDDLIREEDGGSMLGAKKENAPTNHPNILYNCVPTEKDGKRTGTTLILKDKSEAMRRAEQLNGTRHIVSALRANTHEFMNKLQVLSGLLQMGRQEEALGYISNISAFHTKATGPLLQHIHNPNVAALLLGKLNNMRELDVSLTLLASSDLPEHSQYLSTTELVTIVGNLMENAIEAVDGQSGDGPRSVVLQITEDNSGLLILVADTGMGIAPENLERIYDQGFSTKAAEGRGVGMNLIHSIVDRRHGSIEVDSEPGNGTTFTLIFSEKR